MARKDITAWLQREWTSGASKDGARLIDTPGEGARRAQYTRTLGETQEGGEKLIWAKMSDSVLEIDVCFSQSCVEQFNNDNNETITSFGSDKALFKLIDWRFSLSTPPLNPSSRSAGVQTRKIVCLKINYLQYYGSGNRQIILDQGKALVDFRRNDEVRKQLESIENPREVRDVGAEEMVVYADELPSSAPKQPKPPPRALPPKEHLTFKVAPSRKSTTTSLPTSLSSYDWSLVWPPPNESYSSFNVPSSKISETCERRRKSWIESWVRYGKKAGKKVDPELEKREEARGREEKKRKRERERESSSSDAVASTSTTKNEKSISRRPTPVNPLPTRSNTKAAEPPRSKPSQITRSSNSPSQHLSQSNSSSNPSQGRLVVKKEKGDSKKVDMKGKGKEKEVVIEGEEEQINKEWELDDPPSFTSSLLLKNDETPSSGTVRLCQQQQQMDEEKSVRTPFAAPPDDSSVVESDVELEVEGDSDGDTVMGEKNGVSREEEDSADESEEDVANSLLSQRQDKKNVSSPLTLTGQQQQFSSEEEEEEEDADTEDEHQRSSYKTANESKLSLRASRPRPSAPPTTTSRSLLLKPRLLPRPRLSLPSQSSQQPFTQALPSPSLAPPLAAQTKPLTPPTASLFNQTQGDSTMDSSFDLSGQERDMPRGNQEGMREQAEKRKREIRERKEAEEMERRKGIVEEWNEAERRRKEDEETKAREDREREELEAVQQREKEEHEEKERRSREADRKKEKELQKKRKEEEKENVLSRQTSTTSSSSSSKRKGVDTAQDQEDAQPADPANENLPIVEEQTVEEQTSKTSKRPRPATPVSLSPSNTRHHKRPRLSPPPLPATNPHQAAFDKLVEARRTSRPRSPVGETSREKLKRLEKSIKRLSKLGGQDI